MANKYIRHGETFCGDGTTSAAATSNGGVGAWNNINVFEGSAPAYGALAAGDTVYIRSKDNAGANITRTLSASVTIGSSSASAGSPVTWVLDNGSIWAGIDGTLTFNCASTFSVNLRAHNRYIASRQDALVIAEGNAAASYKQYKVATGVHIRNVLYDLSAATTGDGNYISFPAGSIQLEAVNIHVKSAKRPSALFTMSEGYSRVILISPSIELLNATQTQPVFMLNGGGEIFDVLGGSVSGAGATTGVSLVRASCSGSQVNIAGLQYPKTMSFCIADNQSSASWKACAIGIDGGVGSAIKDWWGEMDSRTDNYYPTLNATLPNSTNSPWSWKLYPSNTNLQRSFRVPVGKFYTETAASKTVTAEILVADSFSGVDSETVRLDVSYIDDSTGLARFASSHDQAKTALATSTANWSATTYGSVNLLKRKLVVTTPTAVKKDTVMVAVISGSALSASGNDIMFIDPDVSVT